MFTNIEKESQVEIVLDNRTSLSYELKVKTAMVHREAESAEFMRKLFMGRFTDVEYAQYLNALEGLYSQLELELTKNKMNKHVGPIYLPELFRLNSIKKDLEFFSEVEFENSLLDSAVEKYRSRLIDISLKQPHLLMAHAYTRYLGDLSGGIILGRSLSTKYPNEALSFFHFDFDNIEEWKAKYKELLDSAKLSNVEIEEVCNEAILAFELNHLIFSSIINHN